jgi:predicted branched-subunit amino acid permease
MRYDSAFISIVSILNNPLGVGMQESILLNFRHGIFMLEHNQILLFSRAYGVFFLIPFFFVIFHPLRNAYRQREWFLFFVALTFVFAWNFNPFMGFTSLILFLLLCEKAELARQLFSSNNNYRSITNYEKKH